jgi:glucose/arabinose dehydrogenase
MRKESLRLTFDVLRLTAFSVLFLGTVGADSDAHTVRTKDGVTLKVETFVSGLEVPWSVAFTSATRMLVTERPGRVRVVENGALLKAPLAVIADVESRGETGLMGLAARADCGEPPALPVLRAYTVGCEFRCVVRFRDDGSISQRKVIVEGLPGVTVPRRAARASGRTASCT